MPTFARRVEGACTVHGRGEVGGKAEGMLALQELGLEPPAEHLHTEILTYEFFDRYRDTGCIDGEARAQLEQVLGTFTGPVSVRPSAPHENDPHRPTSGENISFMLPNNHPDRAARLRQLLAAVEHIYRRFSDDVARRGVDRAGPGVAVMVSPIHGLHADTPVGPLFFPLSSGVADSFCTHPITGVDSERGFDFDDGFARLAFGHGYGAVRMDFDVVPVLGVKGHPNPTCLPVSQTMFYALDMTRNAELAGHELETMSGPLHVRHAAPIAAQLFGTARGVDFKELVENNAHGYATELAGIMNAIDRRSGPFQIEFTYNRVGDQGRWHVVQYKRLRDLRAAQVVFPSGGRRPLIETNRVQGHGVIRELSYAVVINPFSFDDARRDEVVTELRRLNHELKQQGERYVLVCPGKVGTTDRKLGFRFDFEDIDGAAVIAEYGYDVYGAPSVELSTQERTGGIYGSHFLYQILGGAAADKRIRQLRAFGSQGTHFLTNLVANGTIYVHVDPLDNLLDGWFFTAPAGQEQALVFAKPFDEPVTAYADLFQKRCVLR